MRILLIRRSLLSLLLLLTAIPSIQAEDDAAEVVATLATEGRKSVVLIELWSTGREARRLAVQTGAFVEETDPELDWIVTAFDQLPAEGAVKVERNRTLLSAKVLHHDGVSKLALLGVAPLADLPRLSFSGLSPKAAGEMLHVLEGEAPAGQPATPAAFALREVNPAGVRQIRIHAELHQGCIGAPVFSEKGEAVGLVTGVVPLSGNEAFYALPSSRIRSFLQDMRLYGRVMERWIGLKFEEAQDIPVVVGVSPGSPAAAAEFQAGDVIYELAGVSVLTLQDLVELGPSLTLDEEVSIRVLRGKEKKVLHITPRRKVRQIN